MNLQETIVQMSEDARHALSKAADAKALQAQLQELNDALTEEDARVLYAALHLVQEPSGEIDDEALGKASGGVATGLGGGQADDTWEAVEERIKTGCLAEMMKMPQAGTGGFNPKLTDGSLLSQLADGTP